MLGGPFYLGFRFPGKRDREVCWWYNLIFLTNSWLYGNQMDISNPAFISRQRTAGYALQSNTETPKKVTHTAGCSQYLTYWEMRTIHVSMSYDDKAITMENDFSLSNYLSSPAVMHQLHLLIEFQRALLLIYVSQAAGWELFVNKSWGQLSPQSSTEHCEQGPPE